MKWGDVLLNDEGFVPLFRQYRPQVFANRLEVFPSGLPSEGEKTAVQNLSHAWKRLLDFRAGQLTPDDELKKILNI